MDWTWKDFSRLPVDDQCAWGSWMAPLMACITATDGPILEIGAGDWSTPFLHHYCACVNRELVTVEADKEWAKRYNNLSARFHWIDTGPYLDVVKKLVQERKWSVALVDGSPSETRVHQCLLLKDRTEFLVVHDYSGKECIETFTPEVWNCWNAAAVAPRPRYSPSSLILGHNQIPWFPGIRLGAQHEGPA